MATTATAAGTAYQRASAPTTSSPHSTTAGAATTSTDIALSITSTDSARRPDRVRTVSTTEVMISSEMIATTVVLSHVGVDQRTTRPSSIEHPVPYMSTSATNHSHQQTLSGRGARR